MSLRNGIWLALVVVHAAIFIAAGVGLYPRLAPAVAATMYWALLPLAMLGLPVFREAGLLTPPSAFGWAAMVVFWLAMHWLLAALMAKLLGGRHDV